MYSGALLRRATARSIYRVATRVHSRGVPAVIVAVPSLNKIDVAYISTSRPARRTSRSAQINLGALLTNSAPKDDKKKDEKIPSEEDLRSWLSSLREKDGSKGSKSNDDNSENSSGKPDPKPDEEDSSSKVNYFRIGTIAIVVLGALYLLSHEFATEISQQQFINDLLSRDIVEHLEVVNKEKVRVYLKNRPVNENTTAQYFFTIGSLDAFERQLEEAQLAMGISAAEFVPVKYTTETNWLKVAIEHSPEILFIGLMIWLIRTATQRMGGGGAGARGKPGAGGPGGLGNIFSIGKSNAKLLNKTDKVTVSFKDVAGCDEAKVEIMEFVSFLKHPQKYQELGAKIPKGALLVGPPGTGKTLLAKATAGEAGVPFYSVSGSDFIEMFVGVGPSRVRDLFAQARQNSPCIIFIDEIDAIGRARGGRGNFGGNDERENTLNQLLVEMDGFQSSKGIVVLAGTNRADMLDKALLRPGRFDRTISIDLPDIKARADVFKVHLAPLKLEKTVDTYAKRLAAMTPGFSGADIANVCNEAALIAARHDKTAITMDHFEAAIERVIGGLEKKSRVLSQEEKRIVAFHEAGHAVVSWFLEFGQPLLKVSIIPRGSGALGYAMYVPEERNLYTKEQLLHMVCSALGGRAAEDVVFAGSITTGARDDLEKVTRIAYTQLLKLGMSETLGPASFGSLKGDGYWGKPFSDHTSQQIDLEARKFVNEAYELTKKIIQEHYTEFEEVAKKLLEKEVLSMEDVRAILGPRQWPSNPIHEEYMTSHLDNKTEK